MGSRENESNNASAKEFFFSKLEIISQKTLKKKHFTLGTSLSQYFISFYNYQNL